MDQSHVLKLIVIAFGCMASGSILGSLAALRHLRKKTNDARDARLRRQSNPNYSSVLVKH